MVQVSQIFSRTGLKRCVASGFMDVCPSGNIDRNSIADIYAMPRRNAEKFIEQMFKMFDRDGDGEISFRVRKHVGLLGFFRENVDFVQFLRGFCFSVTSSVLSFHSREKENKVIRSEPGQTEQQGEKLLLLLS